MKYLVFIAALAAAGYYYLEHTRSQSNASALNLVLSEARKGEVDLFALKDALTKHVYAICDSNSSRLLESERSVSDCEQLHDIKHAECNERVFRLAPLTITDRDEVVDYAKRYVRCSLPYEDLSYQPIK
ncbi:MULTISPECIES: hypothetical protein [unclassified Pseudoalteromonas]|uniref:hypothetical protein n=1 Tax=unclassified Pseudoalteromonas TaxID=194690 RepID=UPI000CF66D96|nr:MULTISPECIES: hypothetical protein [unclassified Pseudoalteromonas]